MFSPLTPKKETDFESFSFHDTLFDPAILVSGQDFMAQQRADKTLEMVTSEATSPLSSCGSLKRMRPTELLRNLFVCLCPLSFPRKNFSV